MSSLFAIQRSWGWLKKQAGQKRMQQHQKLAWEALIGMLSSEKPVQLEPTYTEKVLC